MPRFISHLVKYINTIFDTILDLLARLIAQKSKGKCPFKGYIAWFSSLEK